MVDGEKPAISYAPTTTVTRRQFRLLLILTLLNTLMLGFFVCGPAVSKFRNQIWAEYQSRQLQRDQERKRVAAMQAARQTFQSQWQQAANWSVPAGKVLYEEDPDRAAKLLAGAGYRAILSARAEYFPPRQWQVPVFSPQPTGPLNLMGGAFPLLVHVVKLSDGTPGLLCVYFVAAQEMRTGTSTPLERSYAVHSQRMIKAQLYLKDGFSLESVSGLGMQIDQSDRQPQQTLFGSRDNGRHATITWTKLESWENGKIEFELRDIFRLFAGQPDKADPKHFTLPYELDGVPGAIDCFMRNDNVDLVPRSGRIVWRVSPTVRASGADMIWNPYAQSAKSNP